MAAPRMLERIIAGFVIALLISVAAHRARSLSRSGAVAATFVGTAAMTTGWGWGILLVVYFVTSSALSHFRRSEKERLTADIVEKGGARDAMQVFANGGIFAIGALAAAFFSSGLAPYAALAALGALATATADTWATEVGTLYGGTPRSILSFRLAPRGTSGAVSIAGLIASLGGAAFVAYLALALQLPVIAPVVFLAGVLGALADTLLGATVQERRWCASCERSTERRIHHCGGLTSHTGGLGWMTNDVVNLAATFVGAVVAILAVLI